MLIQSIKGTLKRLTAFLLLVLLFRFMDMGTTWLGVRELGWSIETNLWYRQVAQSQGILIAEARLCGKWMVYSTILWIATEMGRCKWFRIFPPIYLWSAVVHNLACLKIIYDFVGAPW